MPYNHPCKVYVSVVFCMFTELHGYHLFIYQVEILIHCSLVRTWATYLTSVFFMLLIDSNTFFQDWLLRINLIEFIKDILQVEGFLSLMVKTARYLVV